jgi:hypothetical protein
MNALPSEVSKYAGRHGLDLRVAACVSVDSEWRVTARSGDQAELKLDGIDDAALGELLREVSIGLSRLHAAPVSDVTLPNGAPCELHLIGAPPLVHALLIDRSEAVERTRALQQLAQESALKVHERGKQLIALRERLQAVTRERDAVADALARERARRLLELPPSDQRALKPDVLHAAIEARVSARAQARRVRLEWALAPGVPAALHELSRDAIVGLGVYALCQAIDRASEGSAVLGTLTAGLDALKVSVSSAAPEFSERERAVLWNGALPHADASELELALYALGALCRAYQGRVTYAGRAPALGTLTASIPRVAHITERTRAVALRPLESLVGEVVVVGAASVHADVLSAAGARVKSLALDDSAIDALMVAGDAVHAVLVSFGETGLKRWAYRYKSSGAGAPLIALASERPSGAVWWDGLLLQPLKPAELLTSVPR